MKIPTVTSGKYIAAAAFLLASSEVLAQGMGMIFFGPPPGIPMLGGVGLFVLSALLAMVSLRFLKERRRGGGNFLVLATVVGALAAGGSGIKLISDAYAVYTVPYEQLDLTLPSPVTIDSINVCYMVTNRTGSTQQINDITVDGFPTNYQDPSDCLGHAVVDNGMGGNFTYVASLGNGGNAGGANGGMGGSSQGRCSDGDVDPRTILGNMDYCSVLICGPNGGGNGGCALLDDNGG